MSEQPWRSESGLTHKEIEQVMSEDPDDRAIREAHGFTYDDDFEDRSLLCRNGCGETYYEIAVCKMRKCPGRPLPGVATMNHHAARRPSACT